MNYRLTVVFSAVKTTASPIESVQPQGQYNDFNTIIKIPSAVQGVCL